MTQFNIITKKIRLALTAFFIFIPLHAQDLINSGPMVGYSTMQEVLLWVQTSENAKVHFEYYEINNPSIRFKTDEKITVLRIGFPTVESLRGLQESIFSLFQGPQLNSRKKYKN